MEIEVNYKNDLQWIKKWLMIWGTEYPLSPKEMDLCTLLIYKQKVLLSKKLSPKEVKDLMLSTSNRKELQKFLKVSESSLNFYINTFKKKGLFDDNGLIINRLLPENELVFKFTKIND